MVETYFVIRDHDCFDLGVSDLQIPTPRCVPIPKNENGTVAKTKVTERSWHGMPLQFNLPLLLSTVRCIIGRGGTTVLPKLISEFSGCLSSPWHNRRLMDLSQSQVRFENCWFGERWDRKVLRWSFYAYFMVQGHSPTPRMGRLSLGQILHIYCCRPFWQLIRTSTRFGVELFASTPLFLPSTLTQLLHIQGHTSTL